MTGYVARPYFFKRITKLRIKSIFLYRICPRAAAVKEVEVVVYMPT